MRGETWTRTLGLVDLLVGICSAQNLKYITSSLYAVLLRKWEKAKKFGTSQKVWQHVQWSLLLHFIINNPFSRPLKEFAIRIFFRFVPTSIFTVLLVQNISRRF
jgi:hypothetical protein